MVKGTERRLPRLTRWQFWGVVAWVVVQFLVGHGRVWEHPTDYRRLIPSIAWSYASVPVLVTDNPFVAESDASGRFRLDGVPAGRVLVAAWAGGSGEGSTWIEVSPGAAARVGVTVAPPGS